MCSIKEASHMKNRQKLVSLKDTPIIVQKISYIVKYYVPNVYLKISKIRFLIITLFIKKKDEQLGESSCSIGN